MEFLELLARCHPLHQLGADALAALQPGMKVLSYKRGQMLLRRSTKPKPAADLVFLVSGSAELRRSFFERQVLEPGRDSTLRSLDHLLSDEAGQIVALQDCSVVRVPREEVEQLLASSTGDYSVEALDEGELPDTYLVSDDEVAADWMSRFLQSPLAHSLPASAIQQVLAKLVTEEVAAGETIVRRGSYGDAMYIVLRGAASIKTDEQGAYRGKDIPLMPGDYFGEESLVADTPRNSSVVMESAGAVARLDRTLFDRLIRSHVIAEADAALMMRAQLAGADDKLVVIDVRFPVEFREGALPHSINIPISLLRTRLSLLDKQRVHLIAPNGGRRSELAVLLLRQAGFSAYLMAPAEQSFGQLGVSPLR